MPRVDRVWSDGSWSHDVEIEGFSTSDEDAYSIAIPGFLNCHSHAFQYAMAGLAENHENLDDDFWSWRKEMYRLALNVTPDDLESIATALYLELRNLGYTQIAEFHYLHHDHNGREFDNPAEMSLSLMRAAEATGIRLTLVPVYYKNGGFGKPSNEQQRRFVFENVDHYLRFVEGIEAASREFKRVGVGIGVHSLRAADETEIRGVAEFLKPGMPFHIHISEQPKEVEECISFYGQRPVEWFLSQFEVDERFNFVHATHVENQELKGLADSNANVVLCPTTEGNLGDGLFPLRDYIGLNGSWSIGTDSHISLDPFEEIRLLDYGHRLSTNSRNTFGKRGALKAIDDAIVGGSNAVAESVSSNDWLILETNHPLMTTAPDQDLINTIIYSGAATKRQTLVDGKGVFAEPARIRDAFEQTLRRLRSL